MGHYLGKQRDAMIKKRAEEIEEIAFAKEIKKILAEEMKDPAGMSRQYKKGISIHNFGNYKSVMEDLYKRTFEDQSNLNKDKNHKCKR